MVSFLMAFLNCVGRNVVLGVQSLKYLPSLPRQLPRTFSYGYEMSIRTLPIVAILSFFIGAVLALQTSFTLGRVGAEELAGALIGLSLARELGPVMAAFLLAGRVGSAVTAELASMKVYEEIDALQTMNLSPVKLLVMPRLVAIFCLMPFLVLMAILVGWIGGQIIAATMQNAPVSPNAYWRALKEFTETSDLMDGLVKGQIFGLAVILISCVEGLSTRGGPREIGTSVTRAVVFSMIFILFADYFITLILM
ncbi:MAG: MlaE family ABC transporter permease [Puniceicoccaceae bacterium]